MQSRQPAHAPPLADRHHAHAQRAHSRRRRRRRLVSGAPPRLGRRARTGSQNEPRERRRRLGHAMRPARARRRRGARPRVPARADRRAAHAARPIDAARDAVARIDGRSSARRRPRSRRVARAAQLSRCRRAAKTFSGRRSASSRSICPACRRTAGASSRRSFSSPPRVSHGAHARAPARRASKHADEPVLPRASSRRRSSISPCARLVRAARLFENPGFSVANVANHLDYSSPQSFGRHVRTIMHMTAVQFRERYDGEGMLQHFRQTLVHSAPRATAAPSSAQSRRGAHPYARRRRAMSRRASRARRYAGISGTISRGARQRDDRRAPRPRAPRGRPPRDRPARARQPPCRRRRAPRRRPFAPSRPW